MPKLNVIYRILETYNGNSLVLNDSSVYMCDFCGSLVLDLDKHRDFHESILYTAAFIETLDN